MTLHYCQERLVMTFLIAAGALVASLFTGVLIEPRSRRHLRAIKNPCALDLCNRG